MQTVSMVEANFVNKEGGVIRAVTPVTAKSKRAQVEEVKRKYGIDRAEIVGFGVISTKEVEDTFDCESAVQAEMVFGIKPI